MTSLFDRSPRQYMIDWTIRQLNPQPYQHLLEIGYGNGRLLTAVARQLKIGYLAGIESSIPLYRQAYKRNSRFIRRQLVQLHIGELHELSYPAHYFHAIYGVGVYASWKDTLSECLRLASMLRIGGKLILLSNPQRYRKDEAIRTEAARLQAACLEAGLGEIHTEYRDFPTGTSMAVTGFKQDISPDPECYITINNRLLNSRASFISNTARMQM